MVIINYINQYYEPKNFTGKTYDKYACYFIKSNKKHRYFGPTIIYNDGTKYWHFNDQYYSSSLWYYSQKKFLKDLDKQWLL